MSTVILFQIFKDWVKLFIVTFDIVLQNVIPLVHKL